MSASVGHLTVDPTIVDPMAFDRADPAAAAAIAAAEAIVRDMAGHQRERFERRPIG